MPFLINLCIIYIKIYSPKTLSAVKLRAYIKTHTHLPAKPATLNIYALKQDKKPPQFSRA